MITGKEKIFRGKRQTEPCDTERTKSRPVSVSDAAGILLFLLAAGMAICSLYLCGSADIWYDELFTMGFLEQPVGRLLSLAARDVHPPLYYLIGKAVVEAVSIFSPGANPVVIAKAASVLPYLGLLCYAGFLVRKRDGWLCAGLFAFCLLAMPQMSNYTTEVRMYGWALFFLTAAFLHMWEILLTGKRRHWASFWIFGICAAYCHYFAAVSAACLYMALAALLLWKRKDGIRENIALWLLCAALSVLAYLPWLPSAISQVSAVREDYWILPLTLSCFGGCVKFVLKPSTGYQLPDYALAVLLFLCLLLLLLRAFWNRKRDGGEWTEAVYASCGIWVLAGTALFGIAVSFLMRPVFIYRYMLPALGGFWYCFAYFVAKKRPLPDGTRQKTEAWQEAEQRQAAEARQGAAKLRQAGRPGAVGRMFLWRILPLVLLIVVGLVDYRSFAQGELVKKEQMERTLEAFDGLGEDSVILFNFDQMQAVAGYYLNRETWLYGDEPEALIAEMFPEAKAAGDAAWVKSLLEEGRTVWFAGSNLAREAVLAEWQELGIVPAETVDSLLLERYWFNLYRLTLADSPG